MSIFESSQLTTAVAQIRDTVKRDPDGMTSKVATVLLARIDELEAAAVPFAADHQNLKISVAGLLKRCAEIVEKSREGKKRGYGYVLRDELLKHLEQVAERYYAGEIAVVDEFLQLYALGDDARKSAKARAQK